MQAFNFYILLTNACGRNYLALLIFSVSINVQLPQLDFRLELADVV